jgi:hypothetical protein
MRRDRRPPPATTKTKLERQGVTLEEVAEELGKC